MSSLLPAEPWTAATWGEWTEAVKQTSWVKGKASFHPLRMALVGHGDGPELEHLLLLIGRGKAMARPRGEPAKGCVRCAATCFAHLLKENQTFDQSRP
jgi:glutamyl-tRNA synthetase